MSRNILVVGQHGMVRQQLRSLENLSSKTLPDSQFPYHHISPTVDCKAGSDWFTVAERAGLLEPKKVEALQTKIINSLRDHVTYNQDAQRKPHYFSRILDKLQVGQHREQLVQKCLNNGY